MTHRLLVASALTLVTIGLAGCVSPQGKLDPHYTNAVRQTIAAQTADPDAQYRRDLPPAASGLRTQGAQERYNEGKVIAPSAPKASSISAGGGGGGGGGDN